MHALRARIRRRIQHSVRGYDSREAVQRATTGLFPVLKTAISTCRTGQATRIHVSGGIAWYPEDGTELMELIKCADFAMYQMKRNEKGRFGMFDRTQYNQTEGDMSR